MVSNDVSCCFSLSNEESKHRCFFILGKQETEVVFNFNTDVEIKPESDPNPETKLTTTT